jgi:hypothetical protein
MRIIRKYIRKLLTEEMTKPSSMLKKYALWTSLVGSGEHLSDGDRAYFVLYDIEEAYSKLRNREKVRWRRVFRISFRRNISRHRIRSNVCQINIHSGFS